MHTDPISKHLAAAVADDLQYLLHFLDETWMEDRLGELDVAEMAGTFRHVLCTCLALELSIDRTESGIVEAFFARFCARFVHRLGVFDVGDAHILDLIRREDAELDLLDDLQRRTGVREVEVRHDCGCGMNSRFRGR